MIDQKTFITWERASHDTIDFKKVYVDVAGDLVAGLILSQIVYWHLPAKDGGSRLAVVKKARDTDTERRWLVKTREEWWDECRVTKYQIDRALELLRERGIVTTQISRFNSKPTTHISLEWPRFLQLLDQALNDQDSLRELRFSRNSGKSKNGNPEKRESRNSVIRENLNSVIRENLNPLTETTTETTAETTEEEDDQRTQATPPPPPPPEPILDSCDSRNEESTSSIYDPIIALTSAFPGLRLSDSLAARIRAKVTAADSDSWAEAVGIWRAGNGQESYNVNHVTALLHRFEKIKAEAGEGVIPFPNGRAGGHTPPSPPRRASDAELYERNRLELERMHKRAAARAVAGN